MMHLLDATESEISIIRSLAHKIWQMHYPDLIGQEQTDYMLARMYTHERLLAQMNAGTDFSLLINEDNQVGFVAIKPLGDARLFIDKLYVDQTAQGKGLGSQALDLISKKYGLTATLSLQVNRQNYKSINFYFKNGFVIDHCLDVEIGGGYQMNDFMMVRKPVR
jgi:diamine N-acetyltransferase